MKVRALQWSPFGGPGDAPFDADETDEVVARMLAIGVLEEVPGDSKDAVTEEVSEPQPSGRVHAASGAVATSSSATA